MNKPVKTTCPYCGVGCGVVAETDQTGKVAIKGDQSHPSNHGQLCSKGSALGETLDMEGRLLYPEIGGARVPWDEALGKVAEGFAQTIEKHGPDSVAFYISGQMLNEDYYVANKLMKGFIGSANIDTNSRLCMASSVAGHKRAFGSDTVPGCYEDLDEAKLIVLIGSNAAWCHPVLYKRIEAAKQRDKTMRVVVIDPRRTATCDIADLHLPLAPGTDSILFNGLLAYLHQNGLSDEAYIKNHVEGSAEAVEAAIKSAPSIDVVSKACGLDKSTVETFFNLFAQTEKTVSLYSQGINQSSSGSDKVNAILNCHLLTNRIGRPGMGPLSLTGQPNAMGGREVGGLANQLAAHLEIDRLGHRALCQKYWNSPKIPEKAGLMAVDMFRAIDEGKIKAVWIMATNPAVSLPDSALVRRALKKCDLTVVSDCVRDTDTTALADILLPAAAWGEKDGTVTNSERRISRQRSFLPLPGEAKPDWWIISEVAKRLKFPTDFSYNGPVEIFREHAGLSGFGNKGTRDFDISLFLDIDDKAYNTLQPIQWPVTKAHPQGTKRMLSDGQFFTDSRSARMIPVSPRAPATKTSNDFPLALNTGRVRDHWHTMTRTAKSSNLSAHTIEPYAELHTDDALTLGINNNDLVRLESPRGEIIVRARVNSDYRRGGVFVPMHWNNEYSFKGCVNALIAPNVDPLSGQPESKYTPVRVSLYETSWQGFTLTRTPPALNETDYWTKVRGKEYWQYEIAGQETPKDWTETTRAMFKLTDVPVDWIEYQDPKAGDYRCATLNDDRLESCEYISSEGKLPSRQWLGDLFDHDKLEVFDRANLLSGRPYDHDTDRGKTVCACFGIGLNTILQAIEKDGLDSIKAIGKKLKAGTNCGSCIPEIRALLKARDDDIAA